MASRNAVKRLIAFLEGVLGTKCPKGMDTEWPGLFAEPGIDDDELLEAGRIYVKETEYKTFPAPGVLFKLAQASTQAATGDPGNRWWEKCDNCQGSGMYHRQDERGSWMVVCGCEAGEAKRKFLNAERHYGRAQNRHGEIDP